jgi:hypothetical protein
MSVTYGILISLFLSSFGVTTLLTNFEEEEDRNLSSLSYDQLKINPALDSVLEFPNKNIGAASIGSTRSAGISKHGGSWQDLFEDESFIDMSMSDNLRILTDGISINSSMVVDQFSSALWLFDEGSGTVAYDSTSNNYDGILGGDGIGTDLPAWTAGKYDGALDFDGTDDFVQTSYIQNTFNNHDFTISVWINLDQSKQDAVIFAIGDEDQDDKTIEFRINFLSIQVWHWYDNWATGYTVSPNIWTHLAYVYHSSNKTGQLYKDGALLGNFVFSGYLNIQDSSFIPAQIGSGYPSRYFDGQIDELWISNKARTGSEIRSAYNNRISLDKTSKTANLTTNTITIPPNMDWDSIYINKSQPANTYINVTIFDASTNQAIPGSPLYTGDGEFDISYIDPVQYPTIKLNVSFVTGGFDTPNLHHLSVSWKTANSWRDEYFQGSMISDYDCIKFIDGTVQCAVPLNDTGYLNSSAIVLPDKYYYDSLIINKSEPAGTQLLVTIYDVLTGLPILDFTGISGTLIDISPLSHVLYPQIQLRAVFKASGGDTPVIFDWSLNWTANRSPDIIEFSFERDSVYRSANVTLSIDADDWETHESALSIEWNYQYNGTDLWFNDYFHDLKYTNGKWQVIFMPDITAKLGNYSFMIKVMDEYMAYDERLYTDIIEVKNNVPGKPVLVITPAAPTTRDELIVTVEACNDIEGEPISYLYQWYRNYLLQPNQTTERLAASETSKGDIWRCEVTPRDSNPGGFGKMNSTAVIIINSAPEVITIFQSITMNEDEIDNSSINLMDIFSDDDNDKLFFDYAGNVNLTVAIDDDTGEVIITPAQNWYGQEDLQFYANDSNAEASIAVTVVVLPQNDPPELVSAGTVIVNSKNQYLKFSVFENNWINLTFTAVDIDGDIVSISSNRTDYMGADDVSGMELDQNTLRFQPDNSHVGNLPIKIILSDSKGGITEYIINLEILNVNNPPSVTIVYPLDNMHFRSIDVIEFRCEYSDLDLSRIENNESLYFTWSSNLYFDNIDSGEYLVRIDELKLSPGIHEITVEVKDRDGLVSTDSVTIIIEEPEKEASSFFESSGFLLVMVLIVVLIVVLIIYIVFIVRKKPTEPEPEIEQPDEEPGTVSGEQVEPVFAEPSAVEQPVVSAVQVETAAQAYPQVQLPVATVVATPEPAAGTEPQTPPPPPPPTSAEHAGAEPGYTPAQPYPEEQATLPPAPTPSPVEPSETETAEEEKLESGLNVLKQLEKLGDLKEKGIISEEEFQRKKEEILKA